MVCVTTSFIKEKEKSDFCIFFFSVQLSLKPRNINQKIPAGEAYRFDNNEQDMLLNFVLECNFVAGILLVSPRIDTHSF